MNLHRAGTEGQWAGIEPEKRNFWQKIAAKTGGVITPANILDAACFALFLSGAHDAHKGRTVRSIVKLGLSRLGDIADGHLAEATETKSPLGEGIDVILDKIEIALIAPINIRRGSLPARASIYLATQNIANTAVSLYGKSRGAEMHTSLEGKLSTFGQSFMIGMYMIGSAGEEAGSQALASGMDIVGDAFLGASAQLGWQSLRGYWQDALTPVPAPESLSVGVTTTSTD